MPTALTVWLAAVTAAEYK